MKVVAPHSLFPHITSLTVAMPLFSTRKRYYTIVGKVKRQHYQDPQVLKEEPVILTHTDVTKSTSRWTMDFLSGQLGSLPITVLEAENFQFLYYNEKRNRASQFRDRLKISNADSNMKYYMQHYLGGLKQLDLRNVLTDSDGRMIDDINSWKWDWLHRTTQINKSLFQEKHNFTGFMIWIGKPGSVTPTHYDQSHVFLSQVLGYKKVTLFAPSQFSNLYPYPAHHLHDRQSLVYFDDPTPAKFPLFAQSQALEAIIGPGEVLFIPAYWWHYVESLPFGEEIRNNREDVEIPHNTDPLEKDLLKMESEWPNKIQLIRTIERVVAEHMGEKKACEYFRDIDSGKESIQHSGKLWQEIVKYASGIVAPEDLAAFVKVMVQGRFENIPP